MSLPFWPLAIAIPVAAALMLCWPLLRDQSTLRGVGAVLVLLIPITTLFLYQGVGRPEAIGMPPPATAPGEQMDDLVGQLHARLEESPDDLEGWLLLGRTYKSLQQYDQALVALQAARVIAPDDPLVNVELAEAMIFTSGSQGIDAEVRQLLEAAVATDPQQQKGLWLLGIVAFQDEDYEQALDFWQRLLPLLEPGSGIAQSVQQQMDVASTRLGIAPAAAWAGFEATVTAPPGMEEAPAGAVLFVIARDPAAPLPPLGAVRVPSPKFPLSVHLSDANSMMPQRPVSGTARIEVIARLSLTGQPIASEGDPESVPVILETAQATHIDLELQP